MTMQVILLERVDSLGNLGDLVTVRPGFARNYLLPQHKALRATKNNLAYFETRKAEIEKENAGRKVQAEKDAKKLDKVVADIIRLASEGGQLYGSVTTRDIAMAVSEKSGIKVDRTQVRVNQTFKVIGLYPVTLVLHPEVQMTVTINIARSPEEAKVQRETGKALVVDYTQSNRAEPQETAKEKFLDDSAMEIEKELSANEAVEAAEAQERSEKSQKRAAKKSAKAAAEPTDGEDAAVEVGNAE
jgi:large subunit ribosomal protein L9